MPKYACIQSGTYERVWLLESVMHRRLENTENETKNVEIRFGPGSLAPPSIVNSRSSDAQRFIYFPHTYRVHDAVLQCARSRFRGNDVLRGPQHLCV